MNPSLTLEKLLGEAAHFAEVESIYSEPLLYGVTDGKAVGTYLEHKFLTHLLSLYSFAKGNSAKGIDIPDLKVDIKVTSVKQPQSSSPFDSAKQKVYGLGYSLLIFVYEKTDDPKTKTGILNMMHVVFVESELTADYQLTRGIRDILDKQGNEEDLMAFILDRHLPVDDIQARNLAEEIVKKPPAQGYLTISNALQWRLQYGRAIDQAGKVSGIVRIR